MSSPKISNPRIEFLFFEGCPHASATLANLKAALAELGLDPGSVTMIDVQSDALDGPFSGSPSIMVNGIDLYTGNRPDTSDFSCRIFEIDGKRTGEIPEHFIRERLTRIASDD